MGTGDLSKSTPAPALGLDMPRARGLLCLTASSLCVSLAQIGRKYHVQFLNLELGKSGQEVQQI